VKTAETGLTVPFPAAFAVPADSTNFYGGFG
jgi:hypothetical protein